MKKLMVAIVVITLAPVAWATDRKHMNTTIDISYGVVESVGQTKINSNAGRNAAVGGVVGAATSGHHHRGKHALEGAVAAGFITAILEGNRNANVYLVSVIGGGEKKIITEQMGIREGDCVALEEGPNTNIRRVPPVHCENHDHDVMSDPIVQAKGQEDAAECHAAKQFLLESDTEQEMEMALKKVQIFCD